MIAAKEVVVAEEVAATAAGVGWGGIGGGVGKER